MCRLKWFYHLYTLTPQNDRLDVAIMACIFIFVIYGHFKSLEALEAGSL